MRAPVRIAIVGYGTAGPLHALAYSLLPKLFPSLPQMPELALIIDTDQRALSLASSTWPVQVRTPDPDLFERFGIDVVDCCAPTPAHGEICRSAIDIGCGVFCEKPLTGNGLAAVGLVDQAAAKNVPLGVNFNFRFVPGIHEAKRLIDGGALGELRSAQVHYYRSSNLIRHAKGTAPTRRDRGSLFDLGPHAIDLVHFLFGRIEGVSARIGHHRADAPSEADDMAMLNLSLANGAFASIEVSKIVPGAGNDLDFSAYGTAGRIFFRLSQPSTVDLFVGPLAAVEHRRLQLGAGLDDMVIIPAETSSSVLFWHAASASSYLHAVAHHTSPHPSGHDGLAVDCVLDAAWHSAGQDGAWTPVGLVGEP